MKSIYRFLFLCIAVGSVSAQARPGDGGRGGGGRPGRGVEILSATYGGNCGARRAMRLMI